MSPQPADAGDPFARAFARPAAGRHPTAITPGPETQHGACLGITGWPSLAATVDALAARLHGHGVAAGDRVAWIGWNDPMQLVLLAACARLGAIQVPLNHRLSVDELRWIEADADYRVLCAPTAPHRRPDTFAHPYIDDLTQRRRHEPGVLIDDPWSFSDVVPPTGGPATVLHALPPPVPWDAPLLLAYTSGTTGRPKGAVLTQAAVAAHAQAAQALFGITPTDTVLTVLPMFHLGGLNIQTVPALLAGARVLLHRRFDPDAFFDALARDRPTLTLLVPAIMAALVAHPRWPTADLTSLRAIGAGSSEVPRPLIEAFHARGIPVQQVYGATETGPIAIAQTRAEALAAPGSLGRPVPGTEARLVDGEIQIRGAHLLRDYWRDPAATGAALRDGWYATGDAGRVDADGRWWFTDRLRHMIISGGENIAPAEVERVLRDAPGVAEVAVCGRPDPRWGEVPVAVVVPAAGFDPAALLAHCEGRLARFKHPRAIVPVAALPRTALGKVNLMALRALARTGATG